MHKSLVKICPICNKVFTVPVWYKVKTDSVDCGRKLQAKKMKGNTFGFQKGHKLSLGRKQSKKTREKISKSMDEQYKKGIRDKFKITKKANEKTRELSRLGEHIFQKYWRTHKHPLLGRTKAKGQYAEHRGFQKGSENIVNKYPEKHPNYILAQKGHKTQPEKVIEKLLIEKGIEYIYNQRIGRYWVDFLLSKKNIILEVDGNYWHQKENKKRDNYLTSKGYKIFHWKVEKYSKLILQKSAEEFIENIK